jgi:hypothetical protein
MKYQAVMLDETNCEFGVSIEADNRQQAITILCEDYPESRCVQLEDLNQMAERERRMYARIRHEYDGEFGDFDTECFDDPY